MNFRIISGKFKGRKIQAPKKLPVRPTTDRSKEALFNILNNQYHFSEIQVIDLFSGTGNISYEFASRGVKQITCVDQNKHCAKFIQKTAADLNIELDIIQSDVFSFLKRTQLKPDIIFADPPYQLEIEKLSELINLTFENQILNQEGMLVIEHIKYTDLSNLSNYSHSKKYGNSVFSFFSVS